MDKGTRKMTADENEQDRLSNISTNRPPPEEKLRLQPQTPATFTLLPSTESPVPTPKSIPTPVALLSMTAPNRPTQDMFMLKYLRDKSHTKYFISVKLFEYIQNTPQQDTHLD